MCYAFIALFVRQHSPPEQPKKKEDEKKQSGRETI